MTLTPRRNSPRIVFRRIAVRLGSLCGIILLALSGSNVVAQENAARPAGELYREGFAAFAAGDWRRAADDLQGVLNAAAAAGADANFKGDSPEAAAIESASYTLGAALFNLGDHAKAIAAFNSYLKKFPRSPRAPDATFALAHSQAATKNFSEAVRLLTICENVPALRERALVLLAQTQKENGRTDDAIAALTKLTQPDIRTAASAQAALTLAGWLAEKGEVAKAVALLRVLSAKSALLDNPARLNVLAIELGDRFLKAGQAKEAMPLYRLVRSRAELIETQKVRLLAARRALQTNLETIRLNPTRAPELSAASGDLRAAEAAAQAQLAELEKLPAYEPALLLRLGRCYAETDGKWESVVVHRELLERYPDAGSAEREAALYALIVVLAEVAPVAETQAECEHYLRDFPTGPNAGTVAYLRGAAAFQADDIASTITIFGKLIDTQPDNKFREQMLYILANALFQQGRYDDALARYRTYQSDYARGPFAEEVFYRVGLALLFSQKYEDARLQLNSYLARYPQGAFAPDARYRLAVVRFAAEQFPEVVANCQAWEKQYPDNPGLGEVLSLLGDAEAALGKTEEAVVAYGRAVKAAASEEALTYALLEAAKLLQKKGEWEKLSAMFEEFVRARPDSPAVTTALSWIGKAKARMGKPEEAKKFLAGTISKYLADPQRDAVEPMLTQLAQLCARRAAPPSALQPVADAPPIPFEPEKELESLLAVSPAAPAPVRARVLFARAEVARLRKQTAAQEAALREIADGFKPADLSQALLAQVGDFLLAHGHTDRAAALFHRLMEGFPKGDYVDFADAGLGEIAFQKGDYEKALAWFTDCTDKIAAAHKLKDATVGKAKTLLMLGRLEEAKKLFSQIASIREWRGESTAFSTFSLGEIEAKGGRWAEANAHFQRVYVAYGKFLPWVAKAYLHSGECFEKLGKTPEAMNTYREMLRNEKLSGFAEAAQARERLQKLGGQG